MKKINELKIIESHRLFLEEKYHVKSIGIFGSVARREAQEKSDVDVLVEFGRPIGFFDFIKLENFLSEVLQKKVDLISKKALKPAVRAEVLSEVIYV